ncbi:hypothetical protein CC1G_14553 [Coprinopsis cinerea okayama7|uniref:Uncharacterized protein n=1 Tax=Coprinopsis cinerea (strain Okayama-7 / 130 / ATCC MYA-4618 / FGSC 9003) TaxID=240176 RepID=D6RMF9_COPC7|nr:hypothetical protein CC1G_14553 [Coprinopsis cinerea okayama7\|eukprot:XP_002911121.1 hypothetical protein CC1G_14553 [Coprinopsis cinerea okayama7\
MRTNYRRRGYNRGEVIRQCLEALISANQDPGANAGAERVDKKLVDGLQKADSEIDWKLRSADAKDGSYYSDDNLSFEEVIRKAREMERKQSA